MHATLWNLPVPCQVSGDPLLTCPYKSGTAGLCRAVMARVALAGV